MLRHAIWLALIASLGVPAATQQSDPASLSGPPQTIRIQPIDSTHVRLVIEGPENWSVESAAFSFPRSPSPDFVPVVAAPGRNRFTTDSYSMVHDNFDLFIGRSGSLGFHWGSGPFSDEHYPASAQTIRVEPIDATHLRLHLVGPENWIIDSAAFSLLPDIDFVRVVAAPGRNSVTAAGKSRIAETFELSITPSGLLRFKSATSPTR